jgi:hypothetical protein
MIGFVTEEHRIDPVDRFGEPSEVLEICASVLVLARSKSVDFWPSRFTGREGNFVWRNSDSVAMLFV